MSIQHTSPVTPNNDDKHDTNLPLINKAIVSRSQFSFPTMARWGQADDAKLLTLWRTPHNGVDPNKLDVESVKAVHQAHFSTFNYKNFGPLYRLKARKFAVSQSLDGHRKRE